MITIDLVKSKENICRFKVSGHGEFDDSGKDIVCSAVSAVVYGALGALGDLCNMRDYTDVDEGKKSDYIMFELPANASLKDGETAQIILETMRIGLKQIEMVYDEYVKINEREV